MNIKELKKEAAADLERIGSTFPAIKGDYQQGWRDAMLNMRGTSDHLIDQTALVVLQMVEEGLPEEEVVVNHTQAEVSYIAGWNELRTEIRALLKSLSASLKQTV